jgi:hypothetical protein
LSLGAGSEAAVIGVGVAVLLGSGTGVVKAASLRGDMNIKWSRRVKFAVAALDEKTFNELEGLRTDITKILPTDYDPDFDPAEILTDPAPLSGRAEKTAAYYRLRTRMETDLVRLRRLGPVAVGGFSSLVAASTLMTIYYAQLFQWNVLRALGIVLLGVAAVILVATGSVYVVLQHRLATGEILAGTGGRYDQGDTG